MKPRLPRGEREGEGGAQEGLYAISRRASRGKEQRAVLGRRRGHQAGPYAISRPGGLGERLLPLEVEVGALETRITCEPSMVMRRREDHVRILVNRKTECVKRGQKLREQGGFSERCERE